MSIIRQQASKGTLYSFLGMLIGLVTLIFFQTKLLTTEQIGLITFLFTLSQVLAQLSFLGFNGTGRFFTFFSNDQALRRGYLLLAFLVSLIGCSFFSFLVYLFKTEIIDFNDRDSGLINQYFYYVYLLTLLTLLFNVFEFYKQLQFDITSPRIYRELYKRVFILFATISLFLEVVTFDYFMYLWLIANLLPTLLIALAVLKDEMTFSWNNIVLLNPHLKKRIFSNSFFAFIGGTAPLLSQAIILYMVTKNFGLSSTGIYGISLTIVNILGLPNRSAASIAYPIVADAWKTNDRATIQNIYTESAAGLFLTSSFLFTLIATNSSDFLKIIGPDYAPATEIIFYLALGHLISSLGGVNGVIINSSHHYKFDSLLQLILALSTPFIINLLSPSFGVNSPAITVCLVFFILNLCRYLFIWWRFSLLPFSRQTLVILSSLFAVYFVTFLIPAGSNVWANLFLRSAFITLGYLFISWHLSITKALKYSLLQGLTRLRKAIFREP